MKTASRARPLARTGGSDRSVFSAPLIALVEWMRSLRGLGAEPRLASRGPEKDDVAQRSKHLSVLLSQLDSDSLRCPHRLPHPRRPDVWGCGRTRAGRPGIPVATRSPSHERLGGRRPVFAPCADHCTVSVRSVFDRLDAGREARQALKRWGHPWSLALRFGLAGEESHWDALTESAGWLKANPDIRALAGRVGERDTLIHRARILDGQVVALTGSFRAVADELALDLSASVGAPVIHEVHLDTMAWRLFRWVAEQEELHRWVTYRDRAARTGRGR